MAGLIIVAMVSFIVLGTADQFLNSGGRGGGQDDRVVATWTGGKFTQQDISQRIYDRVVLNRFINGIREVWAENTGQPRPMPGQFYSTDEKEIVLTSLLVQEANKLGLVVTDDQVMQHIKRLSGDAVTDAQLTKVLRDISSQDRPVSLAQLVEAFRHELLAQQVQGVFGQFGGLYDYRATPAERWEYFCRLNRRVKLQVYPVSVDAYISDPRIPDPSDEQLRAFYDKYKDRVATPSSPEPGFREARAVKLEYLKADYVKFFEAAKAKIGEEAIRAHFEKGKESYRSSIEAWENMTPRELLDALDEKSDIPNPAAIKAPEPDPTPYEEAVGKFAKRAPRATEPPFTDDEILERNREAIVKRLAEEQARVDMGKALDNAFQKMSQFYGKEYQRWVLANAKQSEDGEDSDAKEPTPPPKFDLAALADPDQGLTYHQTTMLSQDEIVRDKYLSQTFVNRRWAAPKDDETADMTRLPVSEGTRLVEYVFQNKTKMSPFRAEDEVRGSAEGLYRNQYVFWKVDQREEHTPDFADIEDRVRRAWKIANDSGKSARDFARQNAQRIADEINGNKVGGKVQTLKERFADSSDVKETGEFTWYEALQMPTGMSQLAVLHVGLPRLTELEEVEGAENRFFREVFRLDDRQAGVAMNDSGSIAYVVQVFDTATTAKDKLREAFVRAPFRMPPLNDPRIPSEQGFAIVSNYDARVARNAWYEQLEREYDVEWGTAASE